MNGVRSLSTVAKLNVAGLVLTAPGMVLQIAAGSELYPTIPPGPIILLVGAALVALGSRRWAPYVGLVVPVFLTVGGIIAAIISGSFIAQLTEVGQAGIFIGSLAHVVGLITALVAGIIMFRGE
jgi:hypothetical protein